MKKVSQVPLKSWKLWSFLKKFFLISIKLGSINYQLLQSITESKRLQTKVTHILLIFWLIYTEYSVQLFSTLWFIWWFVKALGPFLIAYLYFLVSWLWQFISLSLSLMSQCKSTHIMFTYMHYGRFIKTFFQKKIQINYLFEMNQMKSAFCLHF